MSTRPTIVAHRGNSSIAPQNTMAAFEAAWRAGADFFELDIQVTSDGEAAVIHNSTLDETTSGTGPVAQRTAAEIAALDAGSWFSPVFAGERVPLLSDVVEFLRTHTEIGLVLEIKDDWAPEPLQRALALVADPALEGRLIVESFSVETMRAAHDIAPQLRRELLVGEGSDDVAELLDLCRELDVRGVGPDGRLLQQRPDLVDTLHRHDLTVNVWTLNEPEHWAAAVAVGVDGIVTDRPDRLAGWLSGRGLSDA